MQDSHPQKQKCRVMQSPGKMSGEISSSKCKIVHPGKKISKICINTGRLLPHMEDFGPWMCSEDTRPALLIDPKSKQIEDRTKHKTAQDICV